MIGAEIFRRTFTSNRLLEHPAECQTIDNSALDPEPDDSTRVLVHNDQNPISLQADRFTSEQVEAPQTVLHMTDERQPGGTTLRRRRPIMQGQNPPNHILINRCSELIDVPNAKLICSAICGHPQDGLRRFISTTASIRSAVFNVIWNSPWTGQPSSVFVGKDHTIYIGASFVDPSQRKASCGGLSSAMPSTVRSKLSFRIPPISIKSSAELPHPASPPTAWVPFSQPMSALTI